MTQKFLQFLYANAAFPLLRRRSGVNPLVIYYHIVGDRKVPHIDNLYSFRTPREFERDIDTALRFYRPVSLQDVLAHRRGERQLPWNAFLLTFDDGLRECGEIVAPILKRKGVPATFFVCSAFVDNKELAYDLKRSLLECIWKGGVDSRKQSQVKAALAGAGIVREDTLSALCSVDYQRRAVLGDLADILGTDFAAYLGKVQPYLNSDELQALIHEGHAIGAHSIDHPRYADLTLADQLKQTRESLSFVRNRFGLDYGAFSFPHSDANVSADFFDQIISSGEADLCFGNQGLLEDSIPRNVQRTSMEKTRMPAEAILGRSYLRRFAKRVSGKLRIARGRNNGAIS